MTDIADAFQDYVLFEVPTVTDADAFADRFSRWPIWTHDDGAVWLVSVDLTDVPASLAELMGSVRELVGELGLESILFHLDGRSYLLEAADAPVVTAPLV